MTHRTLIGELGKHVGETVSIAGWIDVRRDHGKIVFLDIRDRSGKVQVICGANHPEALQSAEGLRPESVVSIEGQVNKRPEKMIVDGPNGDIELEALSIRALSPAHELPFEKDTELNIDTHLNYLPLTLRTKRGRDIFGIQAILIEAFRETLREEGFTEFQAPALVGGDAEGGAAAFAVEYYYDQKAYLATSPQLYKQILVGAFERVFATPKVFRGEKHATTRHLSEYSSMDFEMGFIKDHTDVMRVLESFLRRAIEAVGKRYPEAYKDFTVEAPLIPDTIPVLTLREAQKILNVAEEPDLEPEHERAMGEWAKKERGSDFVFITHYPVSKRPFYTYEDENDQGFTRSFDLLFRGLEITTGGQRVHDHDILVEKIRGKGLDPEQFSFYLQAFKYGMPPHGGSATGLERLTARLLGLANVKEAALFPRDLNRIDTLLRSGETEPS